MNVEREIEAANRRIQAQIDASARAALIRIGVDVEAMDRAEAEAKRQAVLNTVEAWGAAVGAAWNAMCEFAEAFAAGVSAMVEGNQR